MIMMGKSVRHLWVNFKVKVKVYICTFTKPLPREINVIVQEKINYLNTSITIAPNDIKVETAF